jgi:adenosylhomocysteine nucleosidase
MDIMASEGSAGEDPNAEQARYHEGSAELLAAANAVKRQYTRGKVVEGTIGSANFWNSEVDRIHWFHTTFGTSVEEMEGAAAAMIGEAFGVPTLGIRVLSNNLANGGAYDATTARDCQVFTLGVVRHYIATLKSGSAS